jgi:hypothetical protein
MAVLSDPVHLLLAVDPRGGLHQGVGRIKGYPPHVLHREYPWLKSRLPCLWTRRKFVSTVGRVRFEVAQENIADPKRALDAPPQSRSLPDLPQCPVCGAIHDRDVNAAQNIARVGLKQMEKVGREPPEPKRPVEWVWPTRKPEAQAL